MLLVSPDHAANTYNSRSVDLPACINPHCTFDSGTFHHTIRLPVQINVFYWNCTCSQCALTYWLHVVCLSLDGGVCVYFTFPWIMVIEHFVIRTEVKCKVTPTVLPLHLSMWDFLGKSYLSPSFVSKGNVRNLSGNLYSQLYVTESTLVDTSTQTMGWLPLLERFGPRRANRSSSNLRT